MKKIHVIRLNWVQGEKTWLARMTRSSDPEKLFDYSFENGSWAKDQRGVLEFSVENGLYAGCTAGIKIYKHVTEDGITGLDYQEILEMIYLEELIANKKDIDYSFTQIKPSKGGVAWMHEYSSIGDCSFAENDDFFLLNGEFIKRSRKYYRNFTRCDSYSEKEVTIENMMVRKNENIQIQFEGNSSITTVPVPEGAIIGDINNIAVTHHINTEYNKDKDA